MAYSVGSDGTGGHRFSTVARGDGARRPRAAGIRPSGPSGVCLVERHLGNAVLEGLTRRARSFVTGHGIRIDVLPVCRLAEQWLALGPVSGDRPCEGVPGALGRSCATSSSAQQVTRVTGDRVDDVALDGFEAVEEVKGMTDTWWRGSDSLMALSAGEAECLSAPSSSTALVYSGLVPTVTQSGSVGDLVVRLVLTSADGLRRPRAS
ncbi:hypothetical protein ACFYW9_27965 [Streptomyces sp. NPDC002698]|uniref:hypothetical protein n=1 Tax=Streptomyces sp. NPDC002698 TaxID=3364660 RepID=UPI00367D6EC2